MRATTADIGGGKLARRRRVQVKASESCATFGQRSALAHRSLTPLAKRQLMTVLRRSEDLGANRRPAATSHDLGRQSECAPRYICVDFRSFCHGSRRCSKLECQWRVVGFDFTSAARMGVRGAWTDGKRTGGSECARALRTAVAYCRRSLARESMRVKVAWAEGEQRASGRWQGGSSRRRAGRVEGSTSLGVGGERGCRVETHDDPKAGDGE
ncbi:hypothetical protein DFH08DRAFT_100444 [Mycena albidolilacea]|uniref:Uncharacterized protein n=1 Tax=Mycena albidolilacea TaxID=1033008 RepID=A0AAD7EUY0_9AGAR|nr:hypothetical protein DFH08DRAFT_100444 [Mycena albidolilacea]